MNPNTPLTLPEVRQQLNDAIQRIVELQSVENQPAKRFGEIKSKF
jgi:hypothetical protein